MTGRRLSGQVALVTGGGRGLGAVLAEGLANNGATVAVAGRSLTHLEAVASRLRSVHPSALAVQADVADADSVSHMVARVHDELGPIDLLVNNAGVTMYGSFWEASMEAWWRVLEINLHGPALCSHAVLQYMVPRGHGRIVNVVSRAADRPSTDGQIAYAVSKAGLVRLTDCLATEAFDQGIRVFGLTPGLVKTDMGIDAEERRGRTESSWMPMSRAVDLLLAMADGTLDTLTGRVMRAQDDMEKIVSHADRIRELDLYQLRQHTLEH